MCVEGEARRGEARLGRGWAEVGPREIRFPGRLLGGPDVVRCGEVCACGERKKKMCEN